MTFKHEVLDDNILSYLDNKDNIKKFEQTVRVFSWFPNSKVPQALQPLLNAYIALFTPLLRDPRDIIFVTHIIFGLCTVVPSAFWMLSSFSVPKLILHALLVGPQAAPFVLMLHCVCHRPLFKKSISFLDGLVLYVLAPFYGHTWNTFYFHHIKHHHVENNGPKDLSSTLLYQRDEWFDFVKYFSRFLFLVIFELPLYFIKTGKYRMAFWAFTSEFFTHSLYLTLLLMLDEKLSVFSVFYLPFILMRFGMMSGNWGQHAFVDPNDPQNDFKSSITCINTVYNKVAFNDGYHTSHHLNSLRHWQDHPEYLIANRDKFARETSIVFKDIDFFGIWGLLMIKDFKGLASHFYQFKKEGEDGFMTEGEVIAFLRGRVRRMTPLEVKKAYGLVE